MGHWHPDYLVSWGVGTVCLIIWFCLRIGKNSGLPGENGGEDAASWKDIMWGDLFANIMWGKRKVSYQRGSGFSHAIESALGRRESNELEDLWREGTQMELLKLVPSERCNYCTRSNRVSEHCYKVRCNHRKEDRGTAFLPQNSLCVCRIPTVLINL